MSETVEVTIEVTQEMIDKGLRGQSRSCVLAHAVHVYWPMARVGCEHIHELDGQFTYQSAVLMPNEMAEYRFAFDMGDRVLPRTFTFRVPKHLAPALPPAPQVKADEAMLRGQASALNALHDTLLRPGVVKSARARLNDLERRIGETRVVEGVLEEVAERN